MNRNLLETKNKEALLEAAKTNALFNKDKTMVPLALSTVLCYLSLCMLFLRVSLSSPRLPSIWGQSALPCFHLHAVSM